MSILDTISSIFKKAHTSVLGIDIGASAIKIVQLRKKRGRAVLETYGELALGPYAGIEIGRATNLPPEKIREALVDLIKEAKVTSNKAGAAIPGGSSLVTIIEMPYIGDAELAQMIPIEARKYVPVPISEVSFDWWIIPKENQNLNEDTAQNEENAEKKVKKIEVLIAVIHNETLSKFQKITKEASLECSFYEIEIWSTLRAVIDEPAKTVMIVDIGAASTKTYIVEGGIIRNSHLINRGSQDVTLAISKSFNISVAQAESIKRKEGLLGKVGEQSVEEIASLSFDTIFSEANRVLLNYEQKFNKNVSKVILAGGGSVIKGLLPKAVAHFETEVKIADPFSKVETPAFLGKILKEAGPEFAVALGVALRRLQETE